MIRIPISTLAAGLFIGRDFKIVAPSLVTVTSRPLPVDCKILSCSYHIQDIWIGYDWEQKIKSFIKTFNKGRVDFTIPFGPKVVFTKSAIAMAPTKDACEKQTIHITRVVRLNQLPTTLAYKGECMETLANTGQKTVYQS